MRRIILAAIAALWIGPALAADVNQPRLQLPVKAWIPPKIICTPAKCSGAYVGILIGTNTQNTNVLPSLNLVSGGNGLFGGDIGYRMWNGNFYLGAEFDALAQTGQSGAAINFNPTDFMGIVQGKIGLSLADIFNVSAPSASQGPLQNFTSQLNSFLMSPYVAPVADCFNFTASRTVLSRYCVGAGAEFSIGGPFTLDAEYLNAPAAAGLTAANIFMLKGHYNF